VLSNQVFAVGDLGVIGYLILLEALLSADNALVLAIMVRHLKGDEPRRALLYGMAGAFILRGLAIILAGFIIKFWWLQLIGALYLVWLPLKHFYMHSQEADINAKPMSFWRTVVAIELMDLTFALDSVLVAVGVVDTGKHPEKTWVVIAGAVIGIALLRFAAGFFIRILAKYPNLQHVAYLLIGWAGLKMVLVAGHTFQNAMPDALPFGIPEMPKLLFWGGVLLIAGIGSWLSYRNPDPVTEEEEKDIERVEDATDLNIDHDADKKPPTQ
jgi:YkoY family integral membrane protein